MSESDNSAKVLHGRNFSNALDDVLKACKDAGLIYDYEQRVARWGEPGCKPNQFYAQFLVCFSDNDLWIIYSSTSLRERMKEVYWDSFNIKRLDRNVSHSVFVYPKNCSDEERFKELREDVYNNRIFCGLDYVISIDELFDVVQNYALRNLNYGSKKGRQGNNFEKHIASILSSECNLSLLKCYSPLLVGNNFGLYTKIVRKISSNENIDISKVRSIIATTDIKRLPSGGNAKADVLLMFIYEDGSYKDSTISCKKTSDEWVSVHEYDYKEFVRVLDGRNKQLEVLLQKFQQCGGILDFGNENANLLEIELKPYQDKLSEWVLGGNYGSGDSETQWAKYLLCYKNDSSFSIHTIDEYISILKSKNIEGQFGSLFKWTYSSGRKGKSIQLKARVIF